MVWLLTHTHTHITYTHTHTHTHVTHTHTHTHIHTQKCLLIMRESKAVCSSERANVFYQTNLRQDDSNTKYNAARTRKGGEKKKKSKVACPTQ